MFRSIGVQVAVSLLVALAGCSADSGGLEADVVRRPAADGAEPDASVEPGVDAAEVDRDVAPVPTRDVPITGGDGGAVLTGTCDAQGSTRPECVCEARSETSCYPLGPASQINVGVCRAGRARCSAASEFGQWGACTGAVGPAREACDGLDNDCDGVVDNGCACRPGAVRPCYTGAAGTTGIGVCRNGSQTCVAGAGGTGAMWGACTGESLPRAETCNGLDDNCNGRADDGIGCTCMAGSTRACYSGPAGTAGVGPCRGGSQTCAAGGTGWGACTGERAPSPETCNMVDDDCNGRVDDLASCTGPAVTCSGAVTGPAGTPVSLAATGSPGTSCRWEVLSRPAGAGAEGTFGNASACATTFSSVIVGSYSVRVTVTDAMGRTATCTTMVTLTGRGLRIELVWDTTGDVDLHLLHPSAPAWWNNPNDCFYGNMRPAWDGGGAVAPNLDVDNTAANGPENIRIDAPPVGSTYRVGVHAYSRVASGTNATVRIYCGNGTTPTRTFARNIRSAAASADNDFWRVADVRMDSAATCTITPLESVVTTAVSRTTR